MEFFLTHRRTHNHPMAQAAKQGKIFAKRAENLPKYQHDGDTSNEWALVTLHKLRLAARKALHERSDAYIYELRDPRPGEIFSFPGGNAYWQLWHAGSAILSIQGVMYPNRSLVEMAESLKWNDPGWTHEFVSDLDCLDQYNWCACEVVVTRPIPDLGAMRRSLAVDREALWRRIEALSGVSLHDLLREEEERLAAANAERRRPVA